MITVRYNAELYSFHKPSAAEFAAECEKVRLAGGLEEPLASEILAWAWEVDSARLTLEEALEVRDRHLRRARWAPIWRAGFRAARRVAVLVLIAGVGYDVWQPTTAAQGAETWEVPAELSTPAKVETPPRAARRAPAAPDAAPTAAPTAAPKAAKVLRRPALAEWPRPRRGDDPAPGAAERGPSPTLPIAAITSSRYFRSHPPEHLVDGDLETGWQTQRKRRRLWIELDLGAAQAVSAVEIANGCQRTDPTEGDMFALNARVRSGRMVLDEGPRVPIAFDADAGRGFTRFEIGDHTTRRIRIELRRFHWGERWRRDVCLTEIRVYGG